MTLIKSKKYFRKLAIFSFKKESNYSFWIYSLFFPLFLIHEFLSLKESKVSKSILKSQFIYLMEIWFAIYLSYKTIVWKSMKIHIIFLRSPSKFFIRVFSCVSSRRNSFSSNNKKYQKMFHFFTLNVS